MAHPLPVSFRRHSALAGALLLSAVSLSACRFTGASDRLSLTQSQSIRSAVSFLSDQTPLGAGTGPGAHVKDRSRAGADAPLSLGGTRYARGLGVQAGSALEYNVGAQCRSFNAQIGVDDGAAAGSAVSFSVVADGRVLLPPTEMAAGAAPRTVNVDIEGVERLKLLVETRGGPKDSPADWADAKLQGCVSYSGPTTVESSGTSPIVITGHFRSDDPEVPAIRINTSQPVVIRNCTLAGRGHLIRSGRASVNVTVQNCRGYGLNPNVRMLNPGRFLSVEGGASVTVENSFLKNTGGIYLLGGKVSPTTVRIVRNRALNIDGRRSDGAGGWLQPAFGDRPDKFFRAQFVQFNSVNGVSSGEIAWNRVENEPGHSRVEDNISMYASSGTPSSRIRIHHNLIRGAYHYPTSLQVYSGGGIITDGCLTRHVDITDNTVLETSNHGIAIAGGEYVSIRNNRVYNTGLLPGGGFSGGDDTGIYVRWTGNCTQRGIDFGSNVVANNSIGFAQPNPAERIRRRDLYIAKASSGAALATAADNATLPPDACLGCDDSDLIRGAVADWEQQASAGGITVGVQEEGPQGVVPPAPTDLP